MENSRHIVVFKSKVTGEWYFRFVADNGEPIGASSEGYHNKNDLLVTIGKYFPDWAIQQEDEDESSR